MKFSLDLAQRQGLSLRQATEALELQLREVRSSIGTDPSALLAQMLKQLSACLNGQSRQIAEIFVQDPVFHSVLLEHAADVFTAGALTPIMAHDIVTTYLHRSQDGTFDVVTEAGEESVTTTLPRLLRAVHEPAKLREEHEALKNIIRKSPGSTGVEAIDELRSYTAALALADALRPSIEMLSALLQTLARVRTRGCSPQTVLVRYLIDVTLLRSFDPVLSDRLVARFVRRARNVVRNGNVHERRFELLVANTVHEFMLIAWGIITPNMFSRQSASVKDDVFTAAEHLVVGTQRLTLRQLAERAGLTTNGVFHWQRWAHVGTNGSRGTDDMVRGFATEVVQPSVAPFLELAVTQELKGRMMLESRDPDAMRVALVTWVEDSAFQALLLAHVTGHWREHVRQLRIAS